MKFANPHLTESVSGVDQLEQTSQQKPSYVDSDSHQDGKRIKKKMIAVNSRHHLPNHPG